MNTFADNWLLAILKLVKDVHQNMSFIGLLLTTIDL